jgi:hypothetical protein
MTASIRGSIRSELGEPVVGVSIKLIHEPTGSAFAKSSSQTGQYQFEAVKEGGPYHLSVNTNGSSAVNVGSINLKIDEAFTHDFVL